MISLWNQMSSQGFTSGSTFNACVGIKTGENGLSAPFSGWRQLVAALRTIPAKGLSAGQKVEKRNS
jgi:hypothetical protein